MKKLYSALLCAMLAMMLSIGIWSLADKDPEVSVTEKRELAARPKFSMSALLDGSYISQFESYYSDTFPAREKLLGMNRKMNQFYYYSPGEQNYLVIDYQGGAEHGGEALADVEAALAGIKQAAAAVPHTAVPPAPLPSTEPESDEPDTSSPEPPELDFPQESEAVSNGSIIVVGDRAMDVPTATWSIVDSYAAAVNALHDALGPDVRTISLITPNSAEFYTPVSMHTGDHSQKEMIDYCYDKMDDGVITVDAYSALREHTDEYIYFRTDHHWTALGAYYAYTNFCKAAEIGRAHV